MWHRRFLLSCTPLVAVILATGARPVAADDSSGSKDGYKTVVAKYGDKSVTIRVKDMPDPLGHTTITDPLDHQRAFSETSSMANKSFALPGNTFTNGNTEFNPGDKNTFITKAYDPGSSAPTVPGLDRKAGAITTDAFNHSAPGFDKTFSTSTNPAQNQTALLSESSTTSAFQGRTAVLGDHGPIDITASPMSDKKYQGDLSDDSRRSLKKMQNGQMLVTDLPNRPLTIDEVRELINHGFKPDTSKPAPEESKPLNDPDYVPQPLRDNPQPDPAPPDNSTANAPKALPVIDDDKDDAVPPPGTMAAPPPENSQPLPQH